MSVSMNSLTRRTDQNVVSIFPAERKLAISEPESQWRSKVIERLEKLIRLKPGWDGYEAQPVSFENAAFVLQMLDSICGDDAPTPQIVPGYKGDLQIEWHKPNGEIELHVAGPNDVRAWRCFAEDPEDGLEQNFANNFTALVNWIEQITEREVDIQRAA